jgi:predicted DNA-binding ribbon-helix-helix protein
LEKDLANAATTSSMLQTALDAKTKEHTTLQSAMRVVCDTLETQEGGQSGSSLRSRLTALYGGVRERVRDALL